MGNTEMVLQLRMAQSPVLDIGVQIQLMAIAGCCFDFFFGFPPLMYMAMFCSFDSVEAARLEVGKAWASLKGGMLDKRISRVNGR